MNIVYILIYYYSLNNINSLEVRNQELYLHIITHLLHN